MNPSPEQRYLFAPPWPGVLIGGLPARVVGILIGGLLAGVLSRVLVPQAPLLAGFVTPLALASALALVRPDGRPLERWLPLLVAHALRRARRPAPRAGVESLNLKVQASSAGSGWVRQSLRGGLFAWSCVLEVPGRDFTLSTDQEKATWPQRWGRWLAAQARSRPPLRRLQLLDRVVSLPGRDHLEHLDAHGDHDSAFFDAYRREQLDRGWALEHQHYLVLQFAGGRAERWAEELESAVERVRRELEELFEAPAKILSARSLSQLLANWFDPLLVDDAAEDKGRDRCEEAWNWFRTRDFFHATLEVRAWPATAVAPDFQLPLLLGGRARRCYSLTLAPIPPARAARGLRATRTGHLSDESLRSRQGFLDSPWRRRERESAEQTEHELAIGHQMFAVAAHVTLSASTAAELQSMIDDARAAASQCQIELAPMPGRQRVGFSCTLPLARGLDDSW